MADGSWPGEGAQPRLGRWWTVAALVGLAVVATGGWLMARPVGDGTSSPEADRPTAVTTSSGEPTVSSTTRGASSGSATSGGGAGAADARRGTTVRPHNGGLTTPSGGGPRAKPSEQQGKPVRWSRLSRAPHDGRSPAARPKPLHTAGSAQAHGNTASPRGSTLGATLTARIDRRDRELLKHYRKAALRQVSGSFDVPPPPIRTPLLSPTSPRHLTVTGDAQDALRFMPGQ